MPLLLFHLDPGPTSSEAARRENEGPIQTKIRIQLQEDGGATVLDTRQGHSKEIKFDIPEARVLQAIQEPANIDAVSRLLGDKAISRDTIEDTLQSFVESDLAFVESGRYLGLALEHDAKDLSHPVRCGFLPMEY